MTSIEEMKEYSQVINALEKLTKDDNGPGNKVARRLLLQVTMEMAGGGGGGSNKC